MSKEYLEETKKDKEHAMSASWGMNPRGTFYASVTSPSFNRVATQSLTRILLCSFILIDEELMEDLSGSESEIRKLRTLMCYYRYFQETNE